MRVIMLLTLLAIPALAGCMGHDHDLRVAFVAKDTATAPHDDLDRLAAFLEEQTGRNVEITLFFESNAALEAVRSGQADLVSVDGAAAWLAWQKLGLEAIASEIRSDGHTYYYASAWVRADSDITSVQDFQGRTSCHTGVLKSAGMFMPLGYLINEGLIDTAGYADDISQVEAIAKDFFDGPILGTGDYAGYEGALRCLSEEAGDIAFIRDTTPADYCTPGTKHFEANGWCLPLDQYREVVQFDQVPEHPFMVNGDMKAAERDVLRDALLALNDSEEGKAILKGTFGTGGIARVESEEHLGGYGRLISLLPGIEAYAKGS